MRVPIVSTSDSQSEVGEVFGEIGGELPAKFGRRFSSFFCWGRSSEAFSTKTPPQISPSNFTTRFWVVAGPTIGVVRGPAQGGGGGGFPVKNKGKAVGGWGGDCGWGGGPAKEPASQCASFVGTTL